jgi:hypothetical protein
MQRSNPCWLEIAYIGAAMFLLASCDGSDPVSGVPGTQRSSEVSSSTSPGTNPAPITAGELDLEAARRTLVAMIERSNEPAFKAKLEDLSKSPVKGPSRPESPDSVYWYFGTRTVIRLFNKTWSMEVAVPDEGPWEIFGEFRRKSDKTWEAVETSRHTRGNRGGALP